MFGRNNGESEEFFVTEDGRKVHYLENPLPEPKKHEAKNMDFDVDEVFGEKKNQKNELDFDIDIKVGDDFDV